ncbi:MAG: hypothetical protein PHS02_01355 [Candidatus ainarchaeum sp.]|nr:hypothetical protein [Candidatus ainarchaeum sp.]
MPAQTNQIARPVVPEETPRSKVVIRPEVIKVDLPETPSDYTVHSPGLRTILNDLYGEKFAPEDKDISLSSGSASLKDGKLDLQKRTLDGTLVLNFTVNKDGKKIQKTIFVPVKDMPVKISEAGLTSTNPEIVLTLDPPRVYKGWVRGGVDFQPDYVLVDGKKVTNFDRDLFSSFIAGPVSARLFDRNKVNPQEYKVIVPIELPVDKSTVPATLKNR